VPRGDAERRWHGPSPTTTTIAVVVEVPARVLIDRRR
jgi:hypothetical protein